MSTATSPGESSAVVVGASMAGMLAARALADHFDRVTLIERDHLDDSPTARKGVPQGRQPHGLLPAGTRVLERLFPGYGAELTAAGGVPVRVPADALVLTARGWLDRRADGCTFVTASRPLIEHLVRRRLGRLPNVCTLDRHVVRGPLASADGTRVTGVRVRALDASAGNATDLPADLVVDASGRGSRAPAWLEALGYAAPDETRVDPDVGYASRVYRIPDGFAADWRLAMLLSRPPDMPRFGYLFPIEHGLWQVGLMGAAGQHPPTDPAGFLAFAHSLRHPVIADALAHAEPVTEVRGYRATANRVLHFERMRRRPERLVVLGDAVCAFNPVYGQGVSTAAIGAETLATCLGVHRRRHPDGDLDGLAGRFQRQLARRNADPWMLSTGEDLRFPTTTGVRVTAAIRLRHRYLDRVMAASTHDPAIAGAYARILGMVARPTSLFTPRMLATVVRARPDHASLRILPSTGSTVPAPTA